jgi:leucine dehydrogenase
MGIKASAQEKFGTAALKGMRIAVQGLGNVGSNLVRYLNEEGAVLTVADINMSATKKVSDQFGCKAVSSDEILFTECDILAPCAMGAVVNDQSITKFKTKVIAGGANNVLAEARHGDQLKELGILYAPDYVINAGGLMNVFVELEGYSPERAFEKTKRVFDNISKVYEIAKRDNIGTHTAADRLAEERINTIGRLKQRHPGKSSRAFTTLREINNR